MRFSYEPPGLISWSQEDGDLKSIVGVLRGQLIDTMPEKLKRFVETG